MKKLSFKISRGLKTALVISSLMGIAICSAKHTSRSTVIKASSTFAFIGMVAGLKQKKLWEGLDDGTKAYAEQADAQAEDLQKQLTELNTAKEAIEKQMKEATEKGVTDAKSLKDMEDSVKKMASELELIKNRAGAADKTGAIALALKENDAKIKAFLDGGKKGKLEIEVKAAQTGTDIATHTIGDYVPGIGQLPVRKPFIADIFPVVNTTKEFIKYMDQETAVRDAKNVAHCATSTHNTKLTWKERNIQITKVRDFVDVCGDMMDDYDFVEGEIRKLIETSVSLKVDNGLLLDDGTHPNLHSIDEASSEFDAANADAVWTGKVDKADIFGLVIAMASQIIVFGKDNAWIPDTILWNTIDKYKSMLIKDENGHYLMPPFVAVANNKEYTIDGMKVRSNPLVPANTMYMFDSTKGTIYNRKGVTVELSYENNDNFETETVTVKAYQRLNLLIRNVDKNAFMKCSDVAAAIEAIDSAA